MFVMDFVHCGFSLLMRSFVQVGFTASVTGLTCLGSIYFLPVIDNAHLGSLLLIRSPAQFELAVPVLDFFRLGLSLPIRSYLGSDLALLVSGIV